MTDSLEMTYRGQHGQNRFGDHAYIPTAPLADFHVGRVAFLRVEAMVDQDEHFFFKRTDQRVKRGVIDIRCGTIPTGDQPHWFRT